MDRFDDMWVAKQVGRTTAAWNGCAWNKSTAAMAIEAPQYTTEEQLRNEGAYDEALEAAERELELASTSVTDKEARRERIVRTFGHFSAHALGLSGEAVGLLTDQFMPVGTGLARYAGQFDPTLSIADIIQAARNAWTACGLQPLFGAPVGLTPSILGYSLLYPYSDNLLDDESIRPAEKLAFSERFRRRLQGEPIAALDGREGAMWTLIGQIEGQYERSEFPQVFDSLLAIHRAQENSLGQLHGGTGAEGAALRISCGKGGTSVLADACLVNGRLDQEETRFAFEWGVLLQLGDDLQDVRDDLRRGSITLFSGAVRNGQRLDALTIQLLNFSERVSGLMDQLPQGTATLKELLKMSWRSLIIRAVADSHEFFSPAFLWTAERCSPFRFEFLRARSERLSSRQGLYASLFDALLEPALVEVS